MGAAEELLEAVRVRARGTPYVVTPTSAGFDVAVDLADTTWSTTAYQQGLSLTWIHHVSVDEAARTLSITDDERSLRWRAGVATDGGTPVAVLAASATRQIGRIERRTFRKTWERDATGRYRKTVDVSHGSHEGRDLVRGPARDLGWTERAGAAQVVGLGFALVAGVGAVVAVVVLLHGLLTGAF